MPHTKRVEALADQVAQYGDRIDERIARHVADGTALPTAAAILTAIRPSVRDAVEDALEDIHPDWTARDSQELTDWVMAELGTIVNRSLRDAQIRRRRVLRAPETALQTDDNGMVPLPAPEQRTRLMRAGTLLGVLIAAFKDRRKRAPDPLELRNLSIQAGQPMPRRVGPALKQTIRTRIAEGRNDFAADIADRLGYVIRVGDGRNGPTDQECEDVNGRYATPQWLRNHRVEHPNCSRIGRPARLPAGQQVTLLE